MKQVESQLFSIGPCASDNSGHNFEKFQNTVENIAEQLYSHSQKLTVRLFDVKEQDRRANG